MEVLIRDEQSGDRKAIFELTEAAFEPMNFSDGTEASIVDKLREDGDLTISLVALKGDEIIGHVAFSPAEIIRARRHDNWFGLGPISVSPEHQKMGVGSRLIQEGFSRLEALGAAGCVLVGDPNYYTRFGFKADTELRYQNVPPINVMWIAFNDIEARGEVKFAPAFGDN